MQFTIEADLIRHALSTIKPCTGNKDNPILASVLFCLQDGCIELLAFDLSLGITLKIAADIERGIGQKLAIPYALLCDLLASLKGQVAFTVEDTTLFIKSGDTKFSLALPDASEFPELPILDAVGSQLDFKSYRTQLATIAKFTATEIKRGALCGIYFNPQDNCTFIAATDSHRLATHEISTKTIPDSLVLDLGFTKAAISVFKDHDDLLLSYGNNLVRLESPTCSLIGRTLDGAYPPYQKLFPQSFTQEIELSAEDFKNAIATIAPVAKQKSFVRLDLKPNEILVSARQQDLGEAKTTISCSEEVQPLTIHFNYTYLKDALSDISGTLIFQITDWNRPAVFTGSDGYRHLLMPVQVPQS